ncbi:MAG: LysM peptidoglycan-binding domain-containing protein, partial [Limisphaerales bacterium]
VEDMKALNTSLTTSLNNLSQQVKNQNSAMKKIVESYERALKGFADQGAVDALEKSVRAVEKARKADQAQVARKLADLKKIILENSSRPPIVITQNSSSHSGGRPAREPNIVEHVIKKGETVMDILLAYNGALKQEGRKPSISLQRIRQANPTVNLDRIRVGQKLLIPIID